jgi:hypothetical protein
LIELGGLAQISPDFFGLHKGESFPLVNGDNTCEFESPEIAAIER